MKCIIKFITEIYSSFIRESTIILKDKDILLVASFAIIIYGFIYTYSYGSEILEKVPIVVVDKDNSSSSRELIRKLESTQNVNVLYSAGGMEEAKELMLSREVHGIVYIKNGFTRDIYKNETAYMSVYCDGSYFLAYKQFFMAVNEVMLDMNEDIKYNRYLLSGQNIRQAEFLSQPVEMHNEFLYNKNQGYASFIIPAILILIIQQTILISCGMVFGKIKEHNSLNEVYGYKGGKMYNAFAIVLGRSVFYIISNLLTWGFILTIIYPIFQLPENGNSLEIIAFILPYILSSCFLAIGISTFLGYRESSILYVFFSSLPLLLLSGISWPVEGMSNFWIAFSKLFPSTSAINGFTRLETMGANMNDVASSYSNLWILTLVYFVFAVVSYQYKVIKNN